ncbi:hypothetical protein FZEAL_5264, partial [Fusarium zealandicum]
MSFFKKIAKEFENLGIGDKDKDKEEKKEEYHAPPPTESHDSSRAYGYHGEGGHGGAPPQPAYQPPSDKPPLPEGWTAQFDQQHQRWYYVEVATGRTQWEAPGHHAP